MENWIPDLIIFAAGTAVGMLIALVVPGLTNNKKQTTELVAARTRMLADIKEKHNEEILDQAFRTTEAIRGELDKSLTTLRKTLDAVTPSEPDQPSSQGRPAIQLSQPPKPN
ncbi:MAG: hypothetical protein HW419_4314 [Deltaproteobacteria bacterium]|nr:hypothetical protein [Deltaproteobacteria bacterium]